MRTFGFGLIFLLVCGTSSVLADNLTWGGTYDANWDGFGTSPYTAVDNSAGGAQITIFCIDFNDEIAPPYQWTASIIPLTQANVAGTGAYAGQYAAQYGGDYNSLLTNAWNANPSDHYPSSGPAQISTVSPTQPFAYTGDSNTGFTLTSQDAYTRYLEAAWLITDLESAYNASDTANDEIAQAAAWELFVDSANLSTLTNDVDTYAGTYTFNNYMNLVSGHPTATSGLSFENAVDDALAAAQAAVNGGWTPTGVSLVTATPTWVTTDQTYDGRPVQEFLTFSNVPDTPPVPEPKAVILLATALAAVFWIRRRRTA